MNDNDLINKIPSIIGVEKYYEVNINGGKPQMDQDSLKSLGQLWCKAFVYFLIAIQIEINRRLYMNERQLQLLPEWDSLADMLANMINTISQMMLTDNAL